MRNALVIAIESPCIPSNLSFSFSYGFPRTALLIATCIHKWGKNAGLIPKILYTDTKIRKDLKKGVKESDALATFKNILQEAMVKHDPDLVCVVAPYTNVAKWAKLAARICKKAKPEALIITGGPHASFLTDDYLRKEDPIFDAVILGPGEAKLKHLLENFDDPSERLSFPGISTPDEPRAFSTWNQFNDVQIPDINYRLISKDEMGTGGTVVMAGRGCPNSCPFCLESRYWRNSEVPFYKNAARVRKELIVLSKLGIQVFGLGDSLIDMRHEHFEKFCQDAFSGLDLNEHFFILTRLHMISHEGSIAYRKSGGKAVWVGIETANPDLLTAMGKGDNFYILKRQLRIAKKHGLRIGAFFMFGFPGETNETAKSTLNLMENLFKEKLLDYVDPSIFVPYPGLPLYDDLDKDLEFDAWEDWSLWGRYNEKPVFSLSTLSRNAVYRYWKDAIAIKKLYDIRETNTRIEEKA